MREKWGEDGLPQIAEALWDEADEKHYDEQMKNLLRDAGDYITQLEQIAKAALWVPQTEKTNRRGNVEVPLEDIQALKGALSDVRFAR